MRSAIIFVGLIGLLCLTSCNSADEESKEAEAQFLVTSPIKKDTTISDDFVCQIHSIRNIEIRALEKGYLQDIFVDEGQFVKKGQPMFQIMPKMYQAELKKAAAEADFAEIEYKNTKALADSNIVSVNELALAKAKYDKAIAEKMMAEVHLGFTLIKAPFDGIMDRLHVRQGSLVDEGDLLTTFSDNSEMWVYFNVPEADYLNYQSNFSGDQKMEVELLMANNKQFEYTGIVETIEAEFNNETGNIPFRATFPNPKRLLRHGETGSILMPVKLPDALIIPQKTTFEILDKKYVFVIDAESHVKLTEIEIEAEMPDLYAIKGDLTADSKILLEGLRKVQDGDEISYDFIAPEEVITHLELYSE